MPQSLLRYTLTATDDTPFLVAPLEVWLEYADIFCYDQNCLFGDLNGQDIGITAGDSYTIPHPVNLQDIFFRNAGAGLDTRIIIIGTPYRGKK